MCRDSSIEVWEVSEVRTLNYLDGFSGYGGFHRGLELAGFSFGEVYFSEIDKHAIANYRYNYPNSIYAGSIRDVRRGGQIGDIDLFTFGSPCQDFSNNGKREGLKGGKSSLIVEAIRVISEFRPSVFIWENVKGAFTTNAGADFWGIIQAFADIGGYRLQWQLCDTNWFLPHDRKRIYLVGTLRETGIGGIFPIVGERAGVCEAAGKAEEEEVRNNAQTLSARDYASWNGNYVEISANTSAGFEYAFEGDGIDLSFPDSTTRRGRVAAQKSPTLDTSCNKGVIVGNRIRRLTPVECERLQGLPDGWTRLGNYDGETKEISDTQRYKLCGNGVSVPVVEAIGRKILKQWEHSY